MKDPLSGDSGLRRNDGVWGGNDGVSFVVNYLQTLVDFANSINHNFRYCGCRNMEV